MTSLFMIIFIFFRERKTFEALAQALYKNIEYAIKEIWSKVSDPNNLISYGVFVVLVAFVPQLPEAIKAVALKIQKL